ncbi:sensor histidine kinase [Gorillibacterium timonense]|uniref:sensor histidine kinase n=1 Tax=Gorillibacterium timonense TaxID=1689269 RepID=UPI00071DD21D|nr:sensor histidine kinase [Gorillibacterium timonense]
MGFKRRIGHRFAGKMIAAFLLAILIPLIFTSVSFYRASESIVKENVRGTSVQLAKQTADALSGILNAGFDASDFLYSDLNVQTAVSDTRIGSTESGTGMNDYMVSTLNNLAYSSSFIKQIYVLRADAMTGWGSGTFSISKLQQARLSEEEWTKEAFHEDGEPIWLEMQYDRLSGAGTNTELVLPVARALKKFTSMSNIGLIQINLDGRAILDTIKQPKLGETGTFFVVDEGGIVRIASDLARIGQPVNNPELLSMLTGSDKAEFQYSQDGVDYYGVKQPLNNGWLLTGVVPVKEITGPLDRLQSQILSSAGLFSLVGILIGIGIAGYVTNPVNRLIRDMRRVQQGDLQVRTEIRSTDEIGQLSRQFNKMLQEINSLIQQVEEEQSRKQEAELRAVMHRIQPHFLFNTLSTLRWLIRAGMYERADQGLSALTRLLEANMGKSGGMITIDEELDIIRKYLVIMELRYQLPFRLDAVLDSGVGHVHIPRMLLQPLVENAVFHGLVPKNSGGDVFISIQRAGEGILFLVKNDGLVIDPDRLKVLQNPDKAPPGVLGIGLKHVDDTLRLYYPRRSEWSIASAPEEGTTVRIFLKPEHE